MTTYGKAVSKEINCSTLESDHSPLISRPSPRRPLNQKGIFNIDDKVTFEGSCEQILQPCRIIPPKLTKQIDLFLCKNHLLSTIKCKKIFVGIITYDLQAKLVNEKARGSHLKSHPL